MSSGNLWTISDSNSLLLRTNSLFFHKNSLFCCVGNFTASHWICSCPAHQIRCKPLNFAKFPVNFPVSREFDGGDGFESDCIHHHAVPQVSGPREVTAKAPKRGG